MQDLNKKSRFLVVSKAADLSSYHSDYLTQLCRKKQLFCKQISKVWFVDFASLDNYLRQNKKNWSLPYNEIANGSLIDIHEDFSGGLFIFIDGIEYVDSTKASKISSYNRDYLTQLARSGEILAKKFGKVWFFSLPGLQKHMDKLKRVNKFTSSASLSVRKSNSLTVHKNASRSPAAKGSVRQAKPPSYKYEPEPDFEDIPLVAGKQKNSTTVSISKLNRPSKGFQIHNYIQVKKHSQSNNREKEKIKLLINKVDNSTRQNDIARKKGINISLSEHKPTRLRDINESVTENDVKRKKEIKHGAGIRQKQQIKVPDEVYRSISINYNAGFDKTHTHPLSKAFNYKISERVLPKSNFVFIKLNVDLFIQALSFIFIFASLFMLVLYNLIYYGLLDVPSRMISA